MNLEPQLVRKGSKSCLGLHRGRRLDGYYGLAEVARVVRGRRRRRRVVRRTVDQKLEFCSKTQVHQKKYIILDRNRITVLKFINKEIMLQYCIL